MSSLRFQLRQRRQQAAARLRKIARLLQRALRNREGRIYAWLDLTSRAPLFQDHGTTRFDRYPALFAFVRDRLGADSALQLLSFGCANGAEVFSLRSYFGNAAITGIDIHPDHIAACRRQLLAAPDPQLRFRVAGDTADQASGRFDAIFCLAVLRRGDLASHAERCDHLIRFQDFEAQLEDFARCLRPGGLLVLRHANFRLRDARAARWFETVLRVPPQARADTPLFGADNRRLHTDVDEEAVFRRRAWPVPH